MRPPAQGRKKLASAYLKFRSSRADQAVVAQARAIQDEINTQTDRINDLARQKRGVSSSEQRAVIQQQMDGIAAQVVQLSTTLSAVTTVDRDPGQIVTKGHVVGRSPQTNRLLYSLAGALVVWGIGAAVLFLIGRRRRAIAPQVDESRRWLSGPLEPDGRVSAMTGPLPAEDWSAVEASSDLAPRRPTVR